MSPAFRDGLVVIVANSDTALGSPCCIASLLFLMVLAAAGLIVVSIWLANRGVVPPGYCKSCRYNLTGNKTGVCPECGTPVR